MAEIDGRAYIKLGEDAVACCLRHRRRVRWIPAPGWWIHDDDLPHVPGTVYADGRWFTLDDHRACAGMWNAHSPLVLAWDDTGEVFYPRREVARRRAEEASHA